VPDTLFATDAMRAVFNDRAQIARMLEFEAALALAEADLGIVPRAAAEAIARACDANAFDVAAIRRAAIGSGNLAIPLVAALTRSVAETNAEA